MCVCVSRHLNVSTSKQANWQPHNLPYLTRIGPDTWLTLPAAPARPTDTLSVPLLATHTLTHTHTNVAMSEQSFTVIVAVLLLLLLLQS